MAEYWGIYEGISLALRNGHRRVVAHSDSKVAVESILHNNPRSKGVVSLVNRIRSLIGEFEEFKLVHEYRESNKCAHLLAIAGTRMSGNFTIHQSIPAFLSKALDSDIRGVSTSRVLVV
ncbi:uncharacterized protein LOC131657961 [Vicia villosa]|uniref:uncharacterized protein LOC131657961 n=1 Tax=Vicia villosa TaxID=3911 RepID=UPI00273C0D95|nr:uncharacterized protein LOC131657961 [Vicia villosa]